MNEELKNGLEKAAEDIKNINIPTWDELPSFELYMDQVITLINEYLDVMRDNEDEGVITKNMINNYVKMKIMPPPVRKKYSRLHIAYLIIICMLKQIFSISVINSILISDAEPEEIKRIYTAFASNVRKATDIDISKYAKDGVASEESCVIRFSAEAIILKTLTEKIIKNA